MDLTAKKRAKDRAETISRLNNDAYAAARPNRPLKPRTPQTQAEKDAATVKRDAARVKRMGIYADLLSTNPAGFIHADSLGKDLPFLNTNPNATQYGVFGPGNLDGWQYKESTQKSAATARNTSKQFFVNSRLQITGGPTMVATTAEGYAKIPVSEHGGRKLTRALGTYENPLLGPKIRKILYRVGAWSSSGSSADYRTAHPPKNGGRAANAAGDIINRAMLMV